MCKPFPESSEAERWCGGRGDGGGRWLVLSCTNFHSQLHIPKNPNKATWDSYWKALFPLPKVEGAQHSRFLLAKSELPSGNTGRV